MWAQQLVWIRFIAMCNVVSFGRIGRIVCRIGIRNGLDFLAINDPFIEPDYMVWWCTIMWLCTQLGCHTRLCLKKRPTFDLLWANHYIYGLIATIFGKNVAKRVGNQNMYFIFQRHVTNASALPGESGNPEIASFHLNAACFFTKKKNIR